MTVKEHKTRFNVAYLISFMMVGFVVIGLLVQVGQQTCSPALAAETEPWEKPQRPYGPDFIRDGIRTRGYGGEKVLPWICPISQEELDLFAALVYAEAADQGSYRAFQLVADVVLNRVEDPRWPSTVSGVILQSGQFSPVTDGGLQRGYTLVTEECYEAVLQELQGPRVDYRIQYFSMGYLANGTFAFVDGTHYFGY